MITVDLEILFTIAFTSLLQSIFGTGVLLFGTPILLILEHDFQKTLTILLPASIMINFFQLRNNLDLIDRTFYKSLILFCLPAIFLTLYLSFSININTNYFVGIFLIFISLQTLLKTIARAMNWILNYKRLYLIIMGILHGFTNLGGSLLSGIVFSTKLPKDSKRTTIAISYCSMAFIQMVTMSSVLGFDKFFNLENFIYWASSPLMFILVEKNIYNSVNEKLYTKLSSFFLFFLGLVILIKS